MAAAVGRPRTHDARRAHPQLVRLRGRPYLASAVSFTIVVNATCGRASPTDTPPTAALRTHSFCRHSAFPLSLAVGLIAPESPQRARSNGLGPACIDHALVGMTYFLHTEARISMPGARWPHGLCCAARCVARVSPRTLHKKHRTVCDVAAGPCLHRSACGYTRSLVGPVSVSELVFAGMACPMYKVYAMCAVVTVERV